MLACFFSLLPHISIISFYYLRIFFSLYYSDAVLVFFLFYYGFCFVENSANIILLDNLFTFEHVDECLAPIFNIPENKEYAISKCATFYLFIIKII